jgi:A/G-specific adenine glycosylase
MVLHRGGARTVTTPGPDPVPSTEAVLAWSSATRRDLPWRRTRDPWAVLVSELMLQQTQVARVVPKWEAFIDRFPTPAACAAVAPGEVVRMWAGLGYNRRALRLHQTARSVTDGHGGRLPDRLEALIALPGIGPYTARAVLAFAFEHDVGVIDTNAARVLARAFAGRPLRATEAQRLADQLVPEGRGWEWNQAMLDLGATVCTSRAPACGQCPVATGCAWMRRGRKEPDPAVGSAGASGRQSTFTGSDRQGRGRLVDALRAGPVSLDATVLAGACGWPDDPDRAARIVDGLVADGLAVVDEPGRILSLPG